MRCYWGGQDYPVANDVWLEVWEEANAEWVLAVFHILCLWHWNDRVAAHGGG